MVGMIPNVPMAEALHRQYAPSQAAYELIHTHCQIIAALAVRMADQVNERLLRGDDPEGVLPKRPLDRDLVRIGALLHDIGTYRILKDDGSQGRPYAPLGRRRSGSGCVSVHRRLGRARTDGAGPRPWEHWESYGPF